jgi:prepilin-type N-terminal cleavage/methylation domain-containing protein
MRSYKGFTLVELLVVIAIIAVLLAILIPSLAGAKGMARRLQCSSRLYGLGKAFGAYISAYDSRLPTVEFDENEKSEATRNVIQHYYLNVRDGHWCHLGCLWGHGLIDNPIHYYCPATEGWEADFATGSLASLPLKTHKGYVYWPLSKERYTTEAWTALREKKDQAANENYRPGYPRTAVRQPELQMTRAIVSDYSFHVVKSKGGRGWAVNALFPDGHVNYQPQPRDDGTGTGGIADKGKGMWHECRQFPGEICWITNWNAKATWTDPIEAQLNVAYKSPIVRFTFALEP